MRFRHPHLPLTVVSPLSLVAIQLLLCIFLELRNVVLVLFSGRNSSGDERLHVVFGHVILQAQIRIRLGHWHNTNEAMPVMRRHPKLTFSAAGGGDADFGGVSVDAAGAADPYHRMK